MTYTLRLCGFDDASPQDRRDAERRYRTALDTALGDADLVAPTYAAYLKIAAVHGDDPAPDALTDAEREVFNQWQAAASAAVTAALGPNRYMDDAWFEIGV